MAKNLEDLLLRIGLSASLAFTPALQGCRQLKDKFTKEKTIVQQPPFSINNLALKDLAVSPDSSRIIFQSQEGLFGIKFAIYNPKTGDLIKLIDQQDFDASTRPAINKDDMTNKYFAFNFVGYDSGDFVYASRIFDVQTGTIAQEFFDKNWAHKAAMASEDVVMVQKLEVQSRKIKEHKFLDLSTGSSSILTGDYKPKNDIKISGQALFQAFDPSGDEFFILFDYKNSTQKEIKVPGEDLDNPQLAGNKLLFTSEDGANQKISSYDLTTNTLETLVSKQTDDLEIEEISDKGNFIVYAIEDSQNNEQWFVKDLKTNNELELMIQQNRGAYEMQGDNLLMIVLESSGWILYQVNLNTKSVKKFNYELNNLSVRMSSDAKYAALEYTDTNTDKILIVDSDGNTETLNASSQKIVGWSGHKLVYVANDTSTGLEYVGIYDVDAKQNIDVKDQSRDIEVIKFINKDAIILYRADKKRIKGPFEFENYDVQTGSIKPINTSATERMLDDDSLNSELILLTTQDVPTGKIFFDVLDRNNGSIARIK